MKKKDSLIRDTLTNISSKEFENSISLSSLRELEKYTINFENLFEKENLELDDLSEKFPVYVDGDKNPILYIKSPTYKVKIITSIEKDDLYKILEDIDGKIDISEKDHVLVNPSNQKNCCSENFSEIKILEAICLENSLDENEILKNEICLKLKSKNIRYEVWPGCCVKPRQVKIKDINGKKYITNKK